MKNISKIIKNLYLILFLITPFLFIFKNSELFEVPKMYFIYLITLIIIFLHLINWINGITPLFKKNFLTPFLLFFLVTQTICSLSSIDIHTSFFGYYSRLNGGLLSTICYLLLYLVLTIYIDENQKFKIINISLFSGFIISIYGILQHFGIDKNLWVQDVQTRVFSTLGQPNWLAAYLCILLPLAIYNFLKSWPNKLPTIYYLLLTTSCYLTILFTKSKSGIFAAIISTFIFFIINFLNKNFSKKILIISYSLLIILSLLIANPVKEIIFPNKLKITNSSLEINNLNITPSGDIRKIVWEGSINLFKKFPLLGTGVETFAYSYYWTRPPEHNLTSEWDFLYNKAHNEYLNYLATTGLVGTLPYLTLILFVLIFFFKNITKNSNPELKNLSTALLASYSSILITNYFGFSVVIVSLYFFLIPLFVTDNNLNFTPKLHPYLKYLTPILLIFFLNIFKNITFSYLADIYFAKFESANNRQNYQQAYQNISKAIFLRPNEPNYLINLSIAAAKMAVITKEQQYLDQSIDSSTKTMKTSPANINFIKLQAQSYYYLATIDAKYFINTIESMLQANKLAPTDAKILFSLGQFLESAQLFDDAIYYYQKAINLKPNYDHAYFALGKIYYQQEEYQLAKTNLELNLKYAPSNSSAQKILDEIKTK